MNEEGLHQQADQVSQGLSKQISFLAQDALEIRQVAGLLLMATNDENQHRQRLLALEALVTQLEQKTSDLGAIIDEEQAAVQEIEQLAEEAQERGRMLDALILQAEKEQQENQENSKSNGEGNSHSKPKQPRGSKGGGGARDGRRDSLDPRVKPMAARPTTHHVAPTPIRLTLLSKEEYEAVPRVIRGRTSVMLVNSALEEIERFANDKRAEAAREKRKQHLLRWSSGDEGDDSSNDEPADDFAVSEQELRQACLFFHNGESTARTVLAVLRACGRISQIPNKSGTVVYVLSNNA